MTAHLTDEQLNGYIHLTLSDAERETLDQHLTNCPTCRAHLDNNEGLQRRIRTELTTELRNGRPSTRMSFAAIAPQVKRQRRLSTFMGQSNQLLSGAITAILLIAAGIGLLVLLRNLDQPVPAPQLQVTPFVVEATRPPATEEPQPAETPAGPAEFVMEITGDPNPLSGPVGVAVDHEGNLYVVDGFNHRIQKFGPDGQFLTMWGDLGDGDGEFNFAFEFNYADGSVTVDEQGNVYVADSANSRIQKFNSNGQFLAKWGSYGLEDGRFLHPTGVAVDKQGNVYVVDSGRDDVQKFDRQGQFLTKWGSRGQEEGQLNKSYYLAVDEAGNVYVADAADQRVNKFDQSGQFLRAWGGTGHDEGQFLEPYGIDADSQDHVYVSDRFNHRVQIFDDQGQFLAQWGAPGSEPGQFKEPTGLAVDGSGFIYVADYENDRIQKFRLLEPAVNDAAEESQPSASPAEFVMEITGDSNPFSGPVDVAVDQAGNLYVVDGFNHRIQKFDSDGQFLATWGGEGDGDGQLNLAFRLDTPGGAIALDGQGQIYVADPGNARIQKFDRDGQFLTTWGSYGVEDGQFLAPMGLAVDGAGNVYVSDNKRHDLQMFDGEGQFRAKWGSRGTEAGQIERPFQVTVDPAGNLYVADAESNRINKFDRAGQFLQSWGTMGGDAGQFLQPYGLTIDGQGHIYVSDQFNHRVQIFDNEGHFLAHWGSPGSGLGQFKEPAGLAVDDEGYIYVADSGNNRIQKFRLLEAATSDAAEEGQP